jgi:hypothetical protein
MKATGPSTAAIAAVIEADTPTKTAAPQAPPARLAYPIPEGSLLLGGVSQATVYRWHARGLIKLIKIGGRTLIPASEIARLSGQSAA